MKRLKSPSKGASIRINRGKIAKKFSGFGGTVNQQMRPFTQTISNEEPKKGNKLVIYNLRVKVKTVTNHANKLEQLVYDFKVRL